MMPPVERRPAAVEDLPAIQRLLAEAGLPAADLDLARQEFLLAFDGAALAGCAAVERRGPAVLLRSVAVAPALRGRGLAADLVSRVLEHAGACGARTAWLLTTGAAPWFAKRGFEEVPRASAPEGIRATTEFRETCPASAICMRRAL